MDSEDEELRLSLLGLNAHELSQKQPLKLTRCIGNYALKKFYQNFDVLSSWKECSGSDKVEEDVARMIATQLCSDKSLHDVAQAVLEEVCSRHAAAYAAGNGFFRREEMTLLIRNFGLDRNDMTGGTPPPRSASGTLFPSASVTKATEAYRDLHRSSSEQMFDTGDTDWDSLPASLRPSDIDQSAPEYVDPYVDFSDLHSLDTDFEWSDEE